MNASQRAEVPGSVMRAPVATMFRRMEPGMRVLFGRQGDGRCSTLACKAAGCASFLARRLLLQPVEGLAQRVLGGEVGSGFQDQAERVGPVALAQGHLADL